MLGGSLVSVVHAASGLVADGVINSFVITMSYGAGNYISKKVTQRLAEAEKVADED